jgi:hypothetical protein
VQRKPCHSEAPGRSRHCGIRWRLLVEQVLQCVGRWFPAGTGRNFCCGARDVVDVILVHLLHEGIDFVLYVVGIAVGVVLEIADLGLRLLDAVSDRRFGLRDRIGCFLYQVIALTRSFCTPCKSPTTSPSLPCALFAPPPDQMPPPKISVSSCWKPSIAVVTCCKVVVSVCPRS